TRALIGTEQLAQMRKGARLVNTARPALVSTSAVIAALDNGRLAGYAVDLGYYSRREALPLIRHPGVFAVPHMSWYTTEAIEREMSAWVAALVDLAREPARRSPPSVDKSSW